MNRKTKENVASVLLRNISFRKCMCGPDDGISTTQMVFPRSRIPSVPELCTEKHQLSFLSKCFLSDVRVVPILWGNSVFSNTRGEEIKRKKKHKNIYVTCLCYRAKSFVFGSISLNEGVSCGCQFSLLNSSHRVSACCFLFFLFWGKIPNRVIPPARC